MDFYCSSIIGYLCFRLKLYLWYNPLNCFTMATNSILIRKLNLKDISTKEVLILMETLNTLENNPSTSFLTEKELVQLDRLQFEN